MASFLGFHAANRNIFARREFVLSGLSYTYPFISAQQLSKGLEAFPSSCWQEPGNFCIFFLNQPVYNSLYFKLKALRFLPSAALS
jgi:hypothetical protein